MFPSVQLQLVLAFAPELVAISLACRGTHLFQFEPILREDIEKQAHARALRLGSAEGNRTLEIVQLLMKDTIEDHLVRAGSKLTQSPPRHALLSSVYATQVYGALLSALGFGLVTQHNDLKELRARAAGKKKADKAEYAGKTVTMLHALKLLRPDPGSGRVG